MFKGENYPTDQGRRHLIKGGALAAAAIGTLGTGALAAGKAESVAQTATPRPASTETRFWLTNVTLESGFSYDSQKQVEATKTQKAHLLIDNGKISQIVFAEPAKDTLPRHDMQGLLALPSFADMHVHLDKGYYGGPWKAAVPFESVAQRIREEEGFLRDFLPDTPRKAKALLDLITSYGTTFLRVQCNVDPVIGLENGAKVLEALHAYSDKVDFELVAFPQHGLLANNMAKMMDQAMKAGFTVVGGVGPATIDGDIERSLNTTMEIAVKHDAPIDIHLHNGGQLGTFTIQRLAELTEQAKWHGRVTVSHAYCLGSVSGGQLNDILDRMAAVKMHIHSTAPIDSPMPPVEKLAAKGIEFHLSTDCINDHWSAYGSGSIIERASRLGEINGWDDEFSLNRALKYITRGVTPLDDKGTVVWPKVGDNADLTFVAASCSAELVARRNPVDAVLRRGKASVWNI